jgi:tetratricopeptide (TPR) repeat protein
MRLLEMKAQGEFSLVEVATHNTLSYAILSHTWTDQEVTYQDLVSGAGKSKSGYGKIRFCGEKAAKDGLRYFWVDTCCIDKSNPAELSTAINSMFRWYRSANECYVYLADVSTPSDEADQSRWEAAFRKSRWFTRGWTLQELIAPAIVKFYSKEGRELGDKRSLETLIRDITGIPIQALRGNPFSDFNIAKRKEWAAQRHTTEQEDMVYCLIGLCEVSMPLLYGEGKEAAQKRLETAIKDFTQSNEIFSRLRSNLDPILVSALLIAIISYLCLYTLRPWAFTDLSTQHSSEAMRNLTTSKGGAPFIVPFDRNPTFTGREPQLANLEEKLFGRGQTTKFAIIGLGGVGKTQLVLELVYRVRDKHENCSIIWIPATNMESLHQAYLNIAQQLGITGYEEDKADAKKLVQDHLSKESTGQWLLVFDNADDVEMWTIEAGTELGSRRLIDYLPKSEYGSIVFTSRNRKTAVKLANQNLIEVPELDEDTAIQLLQKSLINTGLVNNRSDMKALLEELTFLPLAIVQAAAYINENQIVLADYLFLLREQESDIIELLSEDFEDNWRYHNIKNPVATTWLISFEQIRHRDPLAADYLSFMACIEPKNIPQSLLPIGASRKKEIDAIGTLQAYSFISKRVADQALDLHRLVHLATRNWLRQNDLITQWTEKAIIRLQEVFPDDDHQNRTAWRTYLPHVYYALLSNEAGKDKETRIALSRRFGRCLLSDGRYNEAEAPFIEVMERHKRVLGQEHPDTPTSMANLASTYRNQGRWKEAEDLEVQVIETRKRVLGAEHPSTLTSIANLASTYRNQGRWKEAEVLFVQVIETSLRVLGAEHPSTLTSVGNLALIYRNQGRWGEAEDLFVQVIETSLRVLGAEHPSTLTSIANLASTFWYQRRLKEAENLFVQVMETRKRVLGAEHPDTLTSMSNLAHTWKEQGRVSEALKLMEKCVTLRSRTIGTNHPHTLSSRTTLLRWQAEGFEIGALVDRE